MTSADEPPPPVTVDMLFRLFDIPPEDGPGRLMRAARREHYTLPYLVLSALANEGFPLGSAAAGELARARRRNEWYAEVADTVLHGVAVTALKGRSLAARYPSGILRAQGDLDLLAGDERALWRAASLLCRERPLSLTVAVFGPRQREYLLSLRWTPEEPLVDPERKVEISTAALTGDFTSVPVRRGLPSDPVLANLVCLAEERLQRPFHRRDALDLFVLSPALSGQLEGVLVSAAECLLAPEIAELIEYTSRWLPVAPLDRVLPQIAALATAERARRAQAADSGHRGRRDTPEAASGQTARVLRHGGLLHGMPLGKASADPGTAAARVHRFGDEALLLTPIGDYLLVTGELVPEATYDLAQRERRRLRGAVPAS